MKYMLTNLMNFLPVFSQLMVVGPVGARGRLVVNPAGQVFRSVLGAARNQHPSMVGKRAREIREKVVVATHFRALVRTTYIKFLQSRRLSCLLTCIIFVNSLFFLKLGRQQGPAGSTIPYSLL